MNIIQSLDFFGNENKFNLNGKLIYKTTLGGFITLFLAFASIVLAWYFGQDIYLRVNPKYILNTAFTKSTPFMTLDLSSFFFAIRIENEKGEIFDDPRYFTYVAEYYYYENSLGINKELIYKTEDMERCNSNYIDNETLIGRGLDKYYCFNFTGLVVGGDWQEKNIGQLTYNVKKCNSETELKYNITCYPDKYLRDWPAALYFDYYIYETVVDTTQFSQPINENAKYHFADFAVGNFSNYVRIYYSKSEVVTDTGVIFDDKSSIYFHENESNTFSSFKGVYYNFLASATLYMTKQKKVYARSYIKIPDVLASVGGILSCALPVIEFLYKIVLDNEYAIFLYSCFFNLKTEDHEVNINIDNQNFEMINIKNPKEITNDKNLNKIDISSSPGTKYKNIYNNDISIYDKKNNNNNTYNVNNNNFNNCNQSANNINSSSDKLTRPVPTSKRKSMLLNQVKNKDIILNKEISKAIYSNNKPLKDVKVSNCSRFLYIYCTGEKKKNDVNNHLYAILNIAEHEIERIFNLVEITRTLDQFRIVKKVILNEGQCLILDSRETKTITEKYTKKLKIVKSEDIIKKEIGEYLKRRKDINMYNDVDKLLLNYLPNEFNKSILNEID